MFVSQATIDRIRGKMHRRVLELPIERGRPGYRWDSELKKCPMRQGGVYHLKPRIPYDQYKAEAAQHPTRARAILCLIDRCETPIRTVTITVTSVERQDNQWLVRFAKGERLELFDQPVYLSRYGDYTMSTSKQTVPGDPELMMPFAEDLAKARTKALESRVSPDRQTVALAKDRLSPLQESLIAMKARNRLRLILKQIGILETELSSDADAILASSDCAAAECPVAGEDADQPCGTHSGVSLESAA